MSAHFADRLTAAIARRGTCTVVGIDPVFERLPPVLRAPAGPDAPLASVRAALDQFCRGVIDAVAPLVPAVKINSAFFEALYAPGVEMYYELVAYAHRAGLLVIGDVKRGDIGSTALLYARGHLDPPERPDVPPERIPDAVTLSGYLGANAVRPFIDSARRHGKGVFVLVRPSDPGADAIHEFCGETGDVPLYELLARLVAGWGRDLCGDCGLSAIGAVVAPKDADSTRRLRDLMPDTPFLVPGYGAQGATAEACRPCFRPDGSGAIINASRSVIYAFDNPRYADRFGPDWQACVQTACRDFIADLRSLHP